VTRPFPSPSTLVLVLVTLGCGAPPAPPAGVAVHDRHDHDEASPSDLDRPVDELLAAVCEHAIPTHSCAECRYEVGVVEVPPWLFDPARGGELTLARVETRPLADSEELTAEVRPDGSRAVAVAPLAAGTVRSVRVDVGDRVAAGQLLLEVESSELRQARAELLRAAAAVSLAEAEAARERDLYARRICPEKDLLEAEARLKQAAADEQAAAGRLLGLGLRTDEVEALRGGAGLEGPGLLAVRAPFAGTVLERTVAVGALVEPGDPLLLVADTSTVWVMTTLYPSQLESLLAHPGAPVPAEVTVAGLPDRVFEGTVGQVSGTVDPVTRTGTARVVIPNPGGVLRPGMFARVRLALPGSSADLAVPAEAVLEDEGRSFVFVRARGDYFVRRPVAPGRSAGGWVAVTGELGPGTEVVSRGAFLLKSDVLRAKMGAGCAD